MSFPTQPAFIYYGSWDENTRAHECMKWMEKYTNAVDSKAWNTEPSSNWLTSNHTLHKSTGETVSGGDASWKALREQVYAPFSEHLHDPQFLVTWETERGWEMVGVATLYWKLAAPGEGSKAKDGAGKEWDGAGPAAFSFLYEKQSDGSIKLSKTAIYADPTAAMVGMLKRGMLKPDDLMK